MIEEIQPYSTMVTPFERTKDRFGTTVRGTAKPDLLNN